jgi:hypothetical protein
VTEPTEPQNPSHHDAVVEQPSPSTVLPPPAGEPVAMAPITPPERPTETPEHASHSRVKAAALLAGAAAVANKVRHEAPKKMQELREKRVAGRHVILAESDGRTIAIGPYTTDEAARAESRNVAGVPTVIELRSPTAYFGPDRDKAEGPPDLS